MFELRVLSGLQQGAALPLVDGEWRIGAADDADLALYDPGVQGRHALLQVAGDQWTIAALAGAALHDADGCPQMQLALLPDVPFAVAGIWLCLAAAGSDWPVAEPLPAPSPRITAGAAPRPSWAKRLVIGIAVVTVASSTWALSARNPPAPEAESSTALRQLADIKTTANDAQSVQVALQRWLRERELAAGVVLQPGTQEVTLNGRLSPERLAAVRQAVARFQAQQQGPVTLIDRLSARDEQLPFRIVQIVGGKQGHVVMADGRRLFLGDQLDGLRLTAIEAGKVTFDGERRFEVSW